MFKLITHHRLFFLCLSLLAAAPFFINLPKVKTVDNVDYFTLENDPDIAFYDEFKDLFGNDEFFIIALKKDNVFTYDSLALLKKLTDELEQVEEIREVKSLANVNDTIGENDYFIVQKFLEEIPDQESDLAKLKTRALSNPLYNKNFISSDGKTTAIVVSVYERPDDPGYRKRLIQKCEEILETYEELTGKTYMAGWTTTNLHLSQYMKRDVATFIPITYAFITLAVFFFFRNIWLTIIAVLNISICMGSTMGLFPLFDITLNNVTTIVPPVIMALALCDTVHIFSHLNKDLLVRFKTKEKALCHVLKKVILPCFLTTLTTGIGFSSLYLSDIPAIKDFAFVATCGMMFEFFFSFLFLPPILLLFNENKIFRGSQKDNDTHPVLVGISKFVLNNFKLICTIGLLIIIASFWFSSKIQVETNLLGFFKKQSVVRVSTDFVEKNLAGTSTLDISFSSTQEEAFKDPEKLKMVEKLQLYIDSIDGVDKTLSFVDFIKDMNQSFHNEKNEYSTIPDSKALVAQYLLLYESDDIDDFVNESFDRARISIRLSAHSTIMQKRIIDKISEFIKTTEHDGLDIQITGRAFQDVKTIDALVKGQIYSLSTATGIIMLIMFFVLRSFSMGCISMIPNLFPILLNFGIMGLFKIPLNTATALIAAVAIGIAVDDTIHFLSEFKLNLLKGIGVKESVTNSILSKGKAILLSSIILCIGFGVMVFSQFIPTINFGALSSIIMVTAVLGDILILPSVALLVSGVGVKFYRHKEMSNGI
ncbi:MAG: MMPL family transporter [Desulfobacterium sp.]|nr:MMPL family transporter [Desulfobacterium sp.]